MPTPGCVRSYDEARNELALGTGDGIEPIRVGRKGQPALVNCSRFAEKPDKLLRGAVELQVRCRTNGRSLRYRRADAAGPRCWNERITASIEPAVAAASGVDCVD